MKQITSKSVKNPLAMIAIFSTISEMAMSYTIVNIPLEIQKIFIWFVVTFPFVLVVGFFFVMYRKPAVLFSPSDYKQDEMYINSINTHQPQNNLKIEQIEESVKILQDAIEKIISTGNYDSSIENEFSETRRKLDFLHAMQQNNLFSFLKNELAISDEDIVQIIKTTKEIRELPFLIMEMTDDQWKSKRMAEVLNQFPSVISDFEQLRQIICGEK